MMVMMTIMIVAVNTELVVVPIWVSKNISLISTPLTVSSIGFYFRLLKAEIGPKFTSTGVSII